MKKPFSGVITALITPFKDGEVDYQSLERLIERQLQDGIDGFVVHGTTGESPTVELEEKKEIFSFIKRRVPKNFPLIVGSGTNSTRESIRLSQAAEKWGADALLTVVPYYNRPPQRGLIEHFNQIAESVKIPVILYNVPTRTMASLELSSVQRLAQHPRIVGIKEASGNLPFAKDLRAACGEEFLLLSGDDATADEFQRQGGDGVISVTSHLIAPAMKSLETEKYMKLVNMLFCEANPIPLKMALYLMKVIDSPELRLPLMALSSGWVDKLKDELKVTGFL